MTDNEETVSTIDDSTIPGDAPIEASVRRAPEITGIPIQSLGQTWHLAEMGLAKILGDQRDRLYNDFTGYRCVEPSDIHGSAWVMLEANYNLPPEAIAAVILGADKQELAEAVLKSLFVHQFTLNDMTYTNYVKSALLANNINPANIAPAIIPHVLHQLVTTGRAIKLQDYTAVDQHAALKTAFLKQV